MKEVTSAPKKLTAHTKKMLKAIGLVIEIRMQVRSAAKKKAVMAILVFMFLNIKWFERNL
jgi:hypothetical protein